MQGFHLNTILWDPMGIDSNMIPPLNLSCETFGKSYGNQQFEWMIS